MAYTPTGRPVGRPKTKDYTTISLKIPQTQLARVQRYARQHGQPISVLIREGLAWRITAGDPSHALRAVTLQNGQGGNTEIPSPLPALALTPGMLEEAAHSAASSGPQYADDLEDMPLTLAPPPAMHPALPPGFRYGGPCKAKGHVSWTSATGETHNLRNERGRCVACEAATQGATPAAKGGA